MPLIFYDLDILPPTHIRSVLVHLLKYILRNKRDV